jgi:hypothetical protein
LFHVLSRFEATAFKPARSTCRADYREDLLSETGEHTIDMSL